jgi:hypothetical protein
LQEAIWKRDLEREKEREIERVDNKNPEQRRVAQLLNNKQVSFLKKSVIERAILSLVKLSQFDQKQSLPVIALSMTNSYLIFINKSFFLLSRPKYL